MGMDGYLCSISTALYEKAGKNPDEAGDMITDHISDEKYEGFLNLQQDWQCLHFLLSGNAGEVDEARAITKAVLGGKVLGDEEVDTVRFLSPAEVKEIARALADTDPVKLAEALAPEDFENAQLYHYDEQDYEGQCEYLVEMYRDLCDFYTKASKKGTAVVGNIT